MKKLVSLTLTLVMIVACLSGLALAAGTVPTDSAKPIAIVTTGATSVECKTVEEMIAAVDASGKSVVAIQQDFEWTDEVAIMFPYSCTIDFGGHTVTTCQSAKTNGFQIVASGSENNITTLQNGTLNCTRLGLKIQSGAGGFVVKNMVMLTTAECLSPDDDTYVGDSYVENSTLISKEWGALAFNADADFTKHTVHIKDTTMISLKGAGCVLLDVGRDSTIGGVVDLGTNVTMYTRSATYFKSAVTVTGEEVTKGAETVTYENTELGVKLDKLNKYATAAPAGEPEVPQSGTADTEVPTTGISVVGLGILAAISAAGAAFTLRKKED